MWLWRRYANGLRRETYEGVLRGKGRVHSWAELSYLTDAVLWPDGWSRAYGVMSLPVLVMQGEVIKACYSEALHVIYRENISKEAR